MANLSKLLFTAGILVSVSITQVLAEGLYLDPQSAEGMSIAQAGIPTGYSDGSSAYYNPAALVIHDNVQFSFQAHYLKSRAKFHDEGSTVLGSPNTGRQGVDGGQDALLPTAYAVFPMTDGITVGAFLNSPFGLGTKYSDDWVGRYQNLETSMRTVNVGTSIGIDLAEGFSVGGGVSAVYADVILSSAIDFGSIAVLSAGPEAAAALGVGPQSADGKVRIEARDWGVGWNVGTLYRFGCDDKYRIGASYRGPTEINFHGGGVNYNVPNAVRGALIPDTFRSTQARSTMTLPEALSMGARVPLSETITLVQQSTWTRWSRAQSIDVTFENLEQRAIHEDLQWNDSWLHSVGLLLAVSPELELSLGGAFEDGIVPSAQRRGPRLPTSDGIWATIGAGYELTEAKLKFNIAYARLDFRGGAADSKGPTGDRMVGSWESLNQAISFSTSMWW